MISCTLSFYKHICRGISLCCSYISKEDSSMSPSIQTPGILEAKKDTEESNAAQMTISSDKLLMKSSDEGTTKMEIDGLSSADDCMRNKKCQTQMSSSSNVNDDISGDGYAFKGRSVSCSTGIITYMTTDCVGVKSSFEIKNSFESHNTPIRSEASSLEIADSLDKDTFMLSAGSTEKTQLMAPLITFSRRYKRKRNREGPDTRGKFLMEDTKHSTVTKCGNSTCGETSSAEAACREGCSVGHASDLKQPVVVHDTCDMVCQIENKVCCLHA